jgi:hypothetical protein
LPLYRRKPNIIKKNILVKERLMSGWLIALTGCIYSYVSIEQFCKGNYGLGIAYAGYSFANYGLYLLATK